VKDSIHSCGESEVIGPSGVAVRWAVRVEREFVLSANMADREIEETVPANLEMFWMEGGLVNNKLEP
jgi:hypothetical protein